MANKITVTSAGTVVNANVTPDSAMYYSNKSKEWAISDKLIDNEDYSSKYYANESKKQANISTAKTTEVVESGNTAVSNIESARNNAILDVNTAGATQVALATEQATIATNKASEVVASGNEALANIDTAKTGALTDITNLKNTSVSNITTVKDNALASITTQETTSKNNVIATGNAQVERVNLTGVDNRTPIFSKSEIGTNEGVYQNVYDLRHSTFDSSKFTVVGSPTITDDGLFYGDGSSTGSGSNYLTFNAPNFTSNSVIEVDLQVRTPSSFGLYQGYFAFKTKSWFGLTPNGNIILSNNGGSAPTVFSRQSLSTDTLYNIKIIVGTNYSGFKYKKANEETWSNLVSYDVRNDLDTIWAIGQLVGANQQLKSGSIDLSHFSITVDGKEVFNGNKTGLDVIKPDNYEVVGSPVISEDGVASGFSTSDYLRYLFAETIDLTKQVIMIDSEYIYNTNNDSIVWYNNNDYWRTRIQIYSGSVSVYFSVNELGSCSTLNNYLFKTGDKIRTIVEYNNTYIKITLYINGIYNNSKTTTYSSPITDILYTNVINIVIGGCYNAQYIPDGSIDLNAFKIYVDGNLVYQPCLKIPYTESKTGSKIVDAIYRDRVIDLYEQEGQAGYYTIDEPNKNFTLPMGEIYGIIGQRSLISSTVTETNRVDIYSDKTCLICGNVSTAGTINLPIELANNNYFITLSTSAKTATSFTTTATGDYILIGKVI